MSLGPILMFDVLAVVVRRREEEAAVDCHASHGGTFFFAQVHSKSDNMLKCLDWSSLKKRYIL